MVSMNNKKNILALGGVLILLVVLVMSWYIWNLNNQEQEVSNDDPLNISIDYYQSWLDARNSDSSNPYEENLNKFPILSKDLRKKLAQSKKTFEAETDPVLCQSVLPTGSSARIVYQQEDEVQILILATDDGLEGQSIFTLNKYNEGWYINDIECRAGEFGEEKEFNFENEGLLIKDVPDSYNSQFWHLVYVENKEMILAPLFFSEESKCIDSDQNEKVCNVDEFNEGETVKTFGQLSETGVDVEKIEFSN